MVKKLFKEKPKRFFSNRQDADMFCNTVNSLRDDVIFVTEFYKKGSNLFVIRTYSNIDNKEGYL